MKFLKAIEGQRDLAASAPYVHGEIGATLLAGAPDTGQLDIYTVDFATGSRNRVHVRLKDQVSIGLSGRGIVADAEGERIMEPGGMAAIPAGHPHWHGATADSAFTHIPTSAPG